MRRCHKRTTVAICMSLAGLMVPVAEALAATEASQPGGGVAPQTRPNVLFIVFDDLRDWIGVLDRYPGVKTPNIDRLAERGLLFTRAYCAAPLCNPSRVSTLCGVRPSTSGVYDNQQPFRPVMPRAVTLPQYLTAHGYFSAGGGKIFHGGFPDPASWQEEFRQQRDPQPDHVPANGIGEAAHFSWGPLDVPDEAMGDAKVAQWAISFLQRSHDKPFFLGVGFYRPHLPWCVPKKYFNLYPLPQIVLPKVNPNDLDDVPPIGRQMANPEGDHRRIIESRNWEKAVQAYLASITFADTCLGQVLDAFDKSPYARNTIVVLWSDHGWHLGEKLHWRKFTLWEEADRSVLAIVAPGVTRPRERCERTVSLLDLYPTLVDLCGLPRRPELEGQDLVPLLKDPRLSWPHPAITTFGRNNHAVRSERWRYIRYLDGTEELYDHDRDPLEWTNLAGQPELAGVKVDLAQYLPKRNAEPAPHGRNQRTTQEGASERD